MKVNNFTIRVYGLWYKDNQGLFVSDEIIKGKYITKLPGGGLELGESTVDALKREWIEELNSEIEVKRHVHTTDFFQASFFDPNTQVIGVYYEVEPIKLNVSTKNKPFDFEEILEGAQSFRFIKDFVPELLSLPTDQKATQEFLKSLKK